MRLLTTPKHLSLVAAITSVFSVVTDVSLTIVAVSARIVDTSIVAVTTPVLMIVAVAIFRFRAVVMPVSIFEVDGFAAILSWIQTGCAIHAPTTTVPIVATVVRMTMSGDVDNTVVHIVMIEAAMRTDMATIDLLVNDDVSSFAATQLQRAETNGQQ